MASVLIVDDNLLVRLGLKQLLTQEYRNLVFGEAKNSEEANPLLAGRIWDVIAIRVSITGQDGFQMLQAIRQFYPATRVLILSPHTDQRDALRARQLQASGYVRKDSSRTELLKAFRSVLAGKEYFVNLPPDGPGVKPTPEHSGLSTRERDILLGCVAGKRIVEIASELNLSIKTVSTYKRRGLDKLQLKSVSDLVRYAIDHHLT
jgi:two-component system, NarL family, invasion response regulator UvrY